MKQWQRQKSHCLYTVADPNALFLLKNEVWKAPLKSLEKVSQVAEQDCEIPRKGMKKKV